MSNLGFSFKFLTLVRDEGGRSPSRAGVRHHVNLETLEGRALLTHMPLHHEVHAALMTADPSAFVHIPKHPHPGPIVNNVGIGYAVKSPRFYEFYKGSARAELNAAGMKATYDASGNLVLTGIVAGTINSTPKTAETSEFYIFGINRGLTTGHGPFPGRPNIKYDAIVAVAITPLGIEGAVYDSTNGTVTPIDPKAILNQGSDIKVFVPANTPGITGHVGGHRTSVVFWAQDSLPTATPNPADIASFAPDGRDVVIAGAPGLAPKRHLL